MVKVDAGNFDRNLDISLAYGDPIAKGNPAAVIVSPANMVLYATRAGELSDARRMSDAGFAPPQFSVYELRRHVWVAIPGDVQHLD